MALRATSAPRLGPPELRQQSAHCRRKVERGSWRLAQEFPGREIERDAPGPHEHDSAALVPNEPLHAVGSYHACDEVGRLALVVDLGEGITRVQRWRTSNLSSRIVSRSVPLQSRKRVTLRSIVASSRRANRRRSRRGSLPCSKGEHDVIRIEGRRAAGEDTE
jgi:hypothetical protein